MIRPLMPPLSVRLRAAVALSAASAVLLGLFLVSAAAAPPTRLRPPSSAGYPPGFGAGSPDATEGGAAAATGTRHRPVLAEVAGLAKRVTYSETKIPLSELVQKIAVDTGVTLTAAREVADEPVAVVVHSMPARELLRQLADLLDYRWGRRSGVQMFRRSGGIHRDEQDEQDESGPDLNWHLVYPGNPVHPVNAEAGPERLNARTPVYEIYQDLASQQREEALRQARLAAVVRRFQEELKIYTEIAALPPEQFQHLAEAAKTYWQERQTLTPEQRQARLNDPGETKLQQRYRVVQGLQSPIPRALATLFGPLSPGQWARLVEEGEAITWSSDPKPAEVRLPLDVERRLQDSKPSWLPPGAHLAFLEPGEEERVRERDRGLQEAWAAASGYRVTLRLDARQLKTQGALMLNVNALPFRNGAPLAADLPPVGGFSGTSLTILSGARDPLSPLEADTPERRAALENDPTLGTKRAFKTAVKPQPNRNGPIAPAWWSLWDLFPDLARTYEVDFIADSYWSSSPGLGVAELPREPTALYTLLDRAAGPTHHWDHRGKLIRLRSRTWFLDRPREVPLRYVRRWKELIAQRGALPLDAYLELVTTLTDTQIESLDRLVVSAVLPTDFFGAELCRDMLRLYGSLLPSQRETLQHGGIIPLSRMTPRQQEQFVATLKRPMGVPPEELTPEQLDRAGLSLKRVPLIRTVDRTKGGAGVSDEPAATAGSLPPGPAAAPGTVDRIPVTRVQFVLAHGQEGRGGVAIVTAP